MDVFKNILVIQSAHRPASAALGIAVHLAQQTNCDVKVVDVRQDLDDWWSEVAKSESLDLQHDSPDQQDRLNALVDEADFPDDVRVKILDGRPIEVLVHELKAGRHDLLLKDAESESADLFFGSLDMRLVRMSPTPLWLADQANPSKLRRILAAIDPHASADGQLVNERVVRSASMLACQEDAELYVVSGWHLGATSPDGDSDDLVRRRELKSTVKRRAWENVEQAVSNSLVKIPADNLIFKHGSGVNVIVSTVIDVQPDLLVMASVAQTGVPGLLIGNTAGDVARQIECSLLTFKPDNFSFLLP